MDFLHNGSPSITKTAVWRDGSSKEKKFKPKSDLTPALLKLLAHPNIASKEWVIRQYDHEVQGGTIIKPLVGIANDGPGDACVIKPRFDSLRGLAVSNGINFRFGDLDPYWIAVSVVEEALRQIICVGGNLKEVAVLDNFCWGNPDKPDRLGGLVRAAYGCYDSSMGFGVPFISGKDSLYNEFAVRNKTMAIPGTLLISAIGVMDDVSCALTMDLKAAGNLLYIVGETFQELGGSHYYDVLKIKGGSVPCVDFKKSKAMMEKLSRVSSKGLVRSMHDCSEGGLAVAVAEMGFAGGLGANIFLKEVPYRGKDKRDDFILFSESNTRFVVEVERKNSAAFERALKGSAFGLIGCVTEPKELKVFGVKGQVSIAASLEVLKEAWQKTLRTL
jgi:phosphoribosylformylglycinamidine synthase